jgi:hypothetical protein
MKKILIFLSLVWLAVIVQAQGLDSIIVEKYYVANAADAAYSAGETNPLLAGSVTYRFYVDLKPGWNLQMAYGNSNHTLNFTTTTTFFNNDDFGGTTSGYTAGNAKKGTTMLDSWLTIGQAASNYWGVMKSEDDGAGNFVNVNGILQNNNALAGIPLTTQDGMFAGAPPAVSFIGTFDLAMDPNPNPFVGAGHSSYVNTVGSWFKLGGVVGPTALNRVLIAQITTDGALSYNLNIIIGDGIGGTENYVANAPLAGELTGPQYKLSGTLSVPSVSVTAPTVGASFPMNSAYVLAANATTPIGTIDSVAFFVGGVRVGSDNTTPFTFGWTPSVAGSVSITAKAYDSFGNSGTSSAVSANVFDPSAAFEITTASNVCTNDIFRMPVKAITATSVTNGIGVDFSLTYDQNKVRPTGIVYVGSLVTDPTWFTTSVNIIASNSADVDSINVSMYLNGTAPFNTVLSGQGNLISIEFVKTGLFNSVDSAQFAINNLVVSTATTSVTKIVTSGKYKTYRDDSFFGSLKFWKDNSVIPYDATHLITNVNGVGSNGSDTATAVTPDVSGNFTFNSLISNKINIRRDIAALTDIQSVVNSADAQLVARILVNDVNVRPTVYQLIAADVNRDGQITAGDLSQINQRSVLHQPEFVQLTASVPALDWVWIDSKTLLTDYDYRISATYPVNDNLGYSRFRVPVVGTSHQLDITGTSCPIIVPETYKGVMLGDVDGSYANIVPSSTLKSAVAEQSTVVFDFANANMSGNFVDVPVYLNSTESVHSLDLALQFNEESLTYSSVIRNAGYLNNTDYYNTDDKTLRIGSYSLKTFDTNKNLVSVRFTMISNVLNSSDLSQAKAIVNGNPAAVKVTEAKSVINPEISFRVYPNPSNGLFEIISPSAAKVELMDITGKSILFETNLDANAKKEINVSNLNSGLYMLKVSGKGFVTVKKLIINK